MFRFFTVSSALVHFVFAEKLLHHQKFGQMVVAAIVQILSMPGLVQVHYPAVLRPVVRQAIHPMPARLRDKAVLRPGRRDRVPGRLQPGLDIAQHREDLRRVRLL